MEYNVFSESCAYLIPKEPDVGELGNYRSCLFHLNKDRKENRKYIWTKNFSLIVISNVLLFLALDMLAPTLPLYAKNIGCTPSQIGLIIGIFSIAAITIRPFAGSLKHLMVKKYILLISILVCAMTTGGYMFSLGLFVLLLFRIVHGLGFGIATTYSATLASEELQPERLGEGMGYYGASESLGMSFGPLIGIAILNFLDFEGLFISGAVILFLATLMILGIKRNTVKEKYLLENKKLVYKFIEKNILPQSFLVMLIGIIFGSIISFLALFVKEQGISASSVAWFFFISAFMGIAIRVISGKIYDKKGPIYALIPAGLGLIIAMLLIAYSQSAIMLYIAAAFYGVGIYLSFPALQAWAISLVEIESREDAMGVFLNFFDLGVGGGSLLLGIIAQATTYKSMYLVSITFIVTFLVLSFYLGKKKNIKSKKMVA